MSTVFPIFMSPYFQTGRLWKLGMRAAEMDEQLKVIAALAEELELVLSTTEIPLPVDLMTLSDFQCTSICSNKHTDTPRWILKLLESSTEREHVFLFFWVWTNSINKQNALQICSFSWKFHFLLLNKIDWVRIYTTFSLPFRHVAWQGEEATWGGRLQRGMGKTKGKCLKTLILCMFINVKLKKWKVCKHLYPLYIFIGLKRRYIDENIIKLYMLCKY